MLDLLNSCLALAVARDGAEIVKIEGLAGEGVLHPLQQAFIDPDGFQRGYCTPSRICAAQGLIAEGRHPYPFASSATQRDSRAGWQA